MTSDSGSRKNNNGLSNFVDVKGLSRDRPWLLPSNRKLRHLQGISLRNLALSRSTNQIRGKTTDDESLPHAFKSPAKLLAQRETHKLEHSRSSIDLKANPLQNGGARRPQSQDMDGSADIRPAIGKLRRRSTLNWTNAHPRVRQKKLEDVTGGRMADTWFSLHCSEGEEPIYVSETINKAMNPSFRFFDLNTYGPAVSRREDLTIKLWARTEKMEDFMLLIERQLSLRSLQFIGKSLENFHHPLPQNCILFHLSDGIYTSFTDLPLDELSNPTSFQPSKLPTQGVQPTSSFDALMRLSNLDDCIQDALATREKLSSQISSLLKEHQQSLATINSASQSQDSLSSTERSLSAEQKLLRLAQKRRSDLQASLVARRTAIAQGTLSQQKAESDLILARTALTTLASKHQSTLTSLQGQTRRICEDLLSIYSIDPIPNKPLSFTICSLPLPTATSAALSSSSPEITSAALSLVAHITTLLSSYLRTPLPYPPTPHGSTSSILDPISTTLHSTPQRTFPLYQKSVPPFRFEYAVFLLNSDIELLMSRQGLRMVDQRSTLPNLKYLLYVLTAGKGELPGRKVGGVRGLRAGEGDGG